jgi:hypothetical protein
VKSALLLVLAFAATACGGAREHGTATLWVTRDRGAQVLYDGTVPAGLTAMQALERARKVTTRYGGRFVQSIDGIDGSATRQRDWFYFVDGIEGDRSAAEVTLRPGDVEWWDYRNWTGSSMSVPVVVGAYPKPFVGGTTTVVPVGVARTVAAAIAKQVRGTVGATSSTKSSIVVSTHFAPDRVRISRVRAGFRLELGRRAARRLAADQAAFRYRYGDDS